VYEAIAGEVVNRRFVLLINIVLNGKGSAFNPHDAGMAVLGKSLSDFIKMALDLNNGKKH
jgi:hypothetical protein